ncbi:MAG: Methionine aminopeptidase [Candidatus Wolfebacteria bacterium GW2011_GWC1_37_10]|uniref:Methionine aminopeptidase n=1 Tax=Candidatus Wolfebacteria bacterium GW2011_GWC1_37_10 TaxID=1619010 RepID=A0A0G0GB75_9BACT|nr:MAG: Methionine aminopeptidase [Candidatus Wolfebacteria bacterium GW2011_GWC1_37_10]
MIKLKSPEDIEKISASGKILSEVLGKLSEKAKIGVSLKSLNDMAYSLAKEFGAQPAFLGYRPEGASRPYLASICASVNNVIVHGFPTDYKLKEGDILKIDFGVKYKNFYSDAAITIGIGEISEISKNLIKAAKEALDQAIKISVSGNTLGDIGYIISKTAKKYGVRAVKGLTGHGIGYALHEEPIIHNFGEKGKGIKLKPGMVLAIEPMFAVSTDKVVQKTDESWATSDNSLSAHFEHTVAITEDGCRILTN